MSNRLHQKNHRFNHHSLRPTQTRDPKFPDAGYDPIASYESPFQGEFYSQGDIITTKSLTSTNSLVREDATIQRDAIVYNDVLVGRDVQIARHLKVNGDLTVLGDTTQLDTFVHVTSAIDVTNMGTGPALRVTQLGSQPIATYDGAISKNKITFNENGSIGMGASLEEGNQSGDFHIIRDFQPTTEIRIQNNALQGASLLSLTDSNSGNQLRGGFLDYNNFTGCVTLENKNETANPSFLIKSAQLSSAVITIGNVGNVGIGPMSFPQERLTVNGNISASESLSCAAIFTRDTKTNALSSITSVSYNTKTTLLSSVSSVCYHSVNTNLSAQTFKGFVVWDTAIVEASSTTILPSYANDVELSAALPVTVARFINGRKGVTYTLTNISTKTMTISSSPSTYVRTGGAWRSNTYSLSTAFISLAPNHSCSVRVGSNNTASVW